ncbi:MAG: LysR family transcriptional regulator substrate-binding protein [Verrucomicrobia bacterium]|nr:LysR family transcriptional regulator substrate-binding protein [Verrucomicrobiota bacterium]
MAEAETFRLQIDSSFFCRTTHSFHSLKIACPQLASRAFYHASKSVAPELTAVFGLLFGSTNTDEILHRLLDGGVDLGVVSRCEPHRALASAPLGKLEFCLFAPAALLPANPKLKIKSAILGHLPLAMLEGSAGIRQAIEHEAQRIGIKLNVRLRFSSARHGVRHARFSTISGEWRRASPTLDGRKTGSNRIAAPLRERCRAHDSPRPAQILVLRA